MNMTDPTLPNAFADITEPFVGCIYSDHLRFIYENTQVSGLNDFARLAKTIALREHET